MLFTYNRVDVAAYAGMPEGPQDVITREPRDTWLVAYSPIVPGEVIRWSVCQKEQHVLIPLVPYLLSTQPELALGYMLQLGLSAAAQLERRVARLHLSLGSPVNEVDDPQYGHRLQFYCGFGIVLG